MDDVRLTVAMAAVMRAFLEDVGRSWYGYELMRLTGFPSGKLYPLLARLERAGWLAKERERIDPALAGRPVRTMYRVTDQGVLAAGRQLSALSDHLRPPDSVLSLLNDRDGRQ